MNKFRALFGMLSAILTDNLCKILFPSAQEGFLVIGGQRYWIYRLPVPEEGISPRRESQVIMVLVQLVKDGFSAKVISFVEERVLKSSFLIVAVPRTGTEPPKAAEETFQRVEPNEFVNEIKTRLGIYDVMRLVLRTAL